MAEQYGTEHGELLMWVQHVLIREEQEAESRRRARPVASASVAPLPVRTWTSGAVDGPTGVGTVLALRRDVIIEQARRRSDGKDLVLVVVKMQPLRGRPAASDAGTVAAMLRTLVEAAEQSLGPRDRIYRSGWRELTVLLEDGDEAGAWPGGRALASRLQTLLAAHHLPAARLTMRLLEPAVVLAVVNPRRRGVAVAARPGPSGAKLSAAV